MIDRLRHATVFALYQLSLLLGIVAMPVAIALARFGVTLPVHRPVVALDEALEGTHQAP